MDEELVSDGSGRYLASPTREISVVDERDRLNVKRHGCVHRRKQKHGDGVSHESPSDPSSRAIYGIEQGTYTLEE